MLYHALSLIFRVFGMAGNKEDEPVGWQIGSFQKREYQLPAVYSFFESYRKCGDKIQSPSISDSSGSWPIRHWHKKLSSAHSMDDSPGFGMTFYQSANDRLPAGEKTGPKFEKQDVFT